MARDSDGLLRHSILLMAATQVANACNLVFHAVMGRALTTEYSLLSTMLNIMLIINMPLEALRTSAAHFTSRVLKDGDKGAVILMLKDWGLKLLVIVSLVALAGILASGPIAHFFHSPSRMPIIITSITTIGVVFIPFLAGALQGLQSFTWMSYALQALSIVRLSLGALLVYTVTRTAMAGLYAQLFGMAAGIAIGGWGLYRLLGSAQPARTSMVGTGGYLGRSFVLLSAFAILMMMDMILVRHYMSHDVAERFARAATIARSIIFLPMPIALALFPKVVSSGSITGETRRMLFKAMAMVVGLIGSGVVFCTIFPQVPLIILYNDRTPEAMQLVRYTMWAMSPLGLTYLLMNFEMAQHRFRATPIIVLCAVGYLAGVAMWHTSVEQIIVVLAVVSVVSALAYLLTLPWRAPDPHVDR